MSSGMQVHSHILNPVENSKINQVEFLAKEFEASFISEMLKHTGLGESPGNFGGGAGEQQFASFLIDHYAKTIAGSGGMGIAEHITKSLLMGQ